MKKANKIPVTLIILFLGLVSVFNLSQPDHLKADISNQIIQSLEIVGNKDPYFPGEDIYFKGTWALPDDGDQIFQSGDSFELTIPDGLSANFKEIRLGDMGSGVLVDDRIVFTFNENIENLVDREGGFNLVFKIKEPSLKEIVELPLDFYDENNQPVFNKTIRVDNNEREVGDGGVFSKTSYMEEGDFLWYLYVNRNGSLDGDLVSLRDNLDHNQRIKKETMKIIKYPYAAEEGASGEDITDQVSIDYYQNNSGFTIDFDISDGSGYYLEYEIEYIGGYDNPDKDEEGFIKLNNTAFLTNKEHGNIPLDQDQSSNTVEGKFDIGGWAQGFEKRGNLKVKKIDEITGEPLANAQFEFTNKRFETVSFIVNIGEDGWGSFDNVLGGLYLVSETKTPEGYLPMRDQEVIIDFSKEENEIVFENSPKPIVISGEKQWIDHKGEAIEVDKDVVIQLYANQSLIRQLVLKAPETSFEFTNLDRYDKEGKKIDYTVSERLIDGYEVSISRDENHFTVVNKQEEIEQFKDIYVRKTWEDHDGEIIKPIEAVTIQLLADNKIIEEVELSPEQQKSAFVFENLPVEENGEVIHYQIQEVVGDDYTSKVVEDQHGVWQITNKVESTFVKGSKSWINKDGEEIKPVAPIEVILLANDIEIDRQTLSIKQQEFIFEDLKKYDNEGNKIEYRVVEANSEDFAAGIYFDKKADHWHIINNDEGTEISVKKEWLNSKGEKMESPMDIDLVLLANRKEVKQATLKKGSQSYIFSDLPLYNQDGEKIDYQIKEVPIEGFHSEVVLEADKQWLIRNKALTKSIKGSKAWINKAGDQIKPATEVDILLLADGIEIKRRILKGSEASFEFSDLAYYDENGKLINYTIEEESELDDFYTSILYDEEDDRWLITNSGKGIDLSVKKTWFDTEGKKTSAPSDIELTLFANDQAVEQVILEKGKETHIFEGLAKYDHLGQKIDYRVEESSLLGYQSEQKINKETNEVELINREESLSIKGEKVWFDKQGNEISSVAAVEIILLANNEKVDSLILDKGSYHFSFENLKRYDEDGEKIIYELVESEQGDFYSSIIYEENQDLWLLANNGKGIDIDVTKSWFDKNQEPIESVRDIEIILLANNEEVDRAILPKGQDNYSFKDLPKYDYSGLSISYRIEEKKIAGFESKVSYNDEEKKWKINNYETVTSVSGEKSWLNKEGQEVAARTDVDIILLANGKEVQRQTLKQGDSEFHFENLSEYDQDGNLIDYEINEEEHEDFTSSILFDQETGRWKVTNNEKAISITVNKSWHDKEGQTVESAQDVNFILYANQQEVAQKTLKKGKSELNFDDLAKYDHQGEEIEYSIEEIPIAGYQSYIKGSDASNHFDVLNIEKTKSLLGKKTWINKEGKEISSAADVEIILLANGEVVDQQTLKKGQYEFVFDQLASHDQDGEEIEYEIQEIAHDDFTSLAYFNPEENRWEIVNNDKGMEIEIVKTWLDIDGEEMNSIADIELEVYANNEYLETVILEKGQESILISNLPKYDHQGEEIVYKIKEKPVSGFKSSLTFDEERRSFNLVNQEQPKEIVGIKSWFDKDGQKGESLSDVVLILYGNDQEVSRQILKQGESSFEFSGLARFDAQGQEIQYHIEEEVSDKWTSHIVYNEKLKRWEISNNEKVLEIKGDKIWLDSQGQEKDISDSVEIILFANNQEVERCLTENNQFVFKNLAKYDIQGIPIDYRLEEESLPGYQTKIDYNEVEDRYYIINQEIPVIISGEKQWKNYQGEIIDPQAAVTFDLYANGNYLKSKTISQEENSFIFKNLPRFDQKNQLINYSIKEQEIGSYQASVDKKDDYDFLITNQDMVIPVLDQEIAVRKEWRNESGQAIDPEGKIEISLKADNLIIDQVTLEAKDQQEHVFKGLAKYGENGEEIIYQIEESFYPGYDSRLEYEGNRVLIINQRQEEKSQEDNITTGVKASYLSYIMIIGLALLALWYFGKNKNNSR